jgi:acylphosphatase
LTRRAHAVIHGRVQGVFFRGDMRERARSLGVNGWVRNNADGTVEAVLEGADDRLELLLSWCRRGPAGARVDDVDVDWEEPRGEGGFAVL